MIFGTPVRITRGFYRDQTGTLYECRCQNGHRSPQYRVKLDFHDVVTEWIASEDLEDLS